ncbi:S-adenosyl-L-methionine-dependent methyltransferase [Favolaschia claudopus]|uniref:S-adenosyl-L-methionine-dependent methyltransferase n=1 Tax=Favolaschia claudopus TaxID=2862362 RepID=A0AAW0AAL9_9AGAR
MPNSSYSSYAVLLPPSQTFLRTYLVTFARNRILSALRSGISTGSLDLFESGHEYEHIGDKNAAADCGAAVLVVKDPNFWIRVFLSYDLGFSEAYMAGEFQTPDLKAVSNLYIDNLDNLDHRLASPFYRLMRVRDIFAMFFLRHGLSKSVENVAGYNASNDMYRAFLSEEMMYSCPLWAAEEGGVRGDLEGQRRPRDLEAAQARKIEHILTKARLKPGDRLLEIGTGWGALAIAAAKLGCTVDTITISTEQQQGAQQNVESAGVQNRVHIHLLDYRNLPPSFEKAFDACVSSEMLEAVGAKNMRRYLQQIDWALKDDRASVVLTASTYPESSYTPYQGNDFTRKYHWPNSVLPSPSSLVIDFGKYTPRRFCVESIEAMGQHYPRCLREWGRRFEENWSGQLESSMTRRYPELKNPEKMAMFRRKWAYMFSYMDIAYARWWLGVTCWTLKRPVCDPYCI